LRRTEPISSHLAALVERWLFYWFAPQVSKGGEGGIGGRSRRDNEDGGEEAGRKESKEEEKKRRRRER
jgi:hypothetical protein